MSAQAALFAPPQDTQPSPRRRFLNGLDETLPSYPRLAAKRIVEEFDTRRDREAALKEVQPDFLRSGYVDTLVADGLALKIAAAPADKIRELLLAEVPEALLARVESKAKSYAATKPWLKRGQA